MDLSSSVDAEGSSVTNFNYIRAQAGRGKSEAGGGGGGWPEVVSCQPTTRP